MKTSREDPDRNPLLDGVLADEDWRMLNAAVKTRALGALRARRRERRLLAWGGSAVAACGLALAALSWASRSTEPVAPIRANLSSPAAPTPSAHPPYITEEQLMSYFPPGSCTIAEIDGERRFIMLDPDIAANGYVLSELPPN